MTQLILDGTDKLRTFDASEGEFAPDKIRDCLREDYVVLIKNVRSEEADDLAGQIANEFNLREGLELQASFAAVKNHRKTISRYFMSVNNRQEYHCILPHSEGGSFANMQLTSFYCTSNTTDGGYTVLLNVDQDSDQWSQLREQVKRGKLEAGSLTTAQKARAKMQYHLRLPQDLLKEGDRAIRERKTEIPGLSIVDALVMPRQTFSTILGRKVFAFWSSLRSTDTNLYQDFVNLLRRWDVYVEPDLSVCNPEELPNIALEDSAAMTIYDQIFKRRLVRKLAPGEMMIMNNQTWTHSATNWTPGSGDRDIGVAIT